MFKHVRLIDIRGFLVVYLFGNYCDVEIDIYVFGRNHTFQFFTVKGFYNHFSAPIC